MFKYLAKGLRAVIAIKLMANRRHLSLQLLKIKAVKCYLHGVQRARLSVIGLMWLGFMIGLIGGGVLLFHAGLFILLPWTVQTKAILGMFLGSVYMGLGFVALHAALNENVWMEKSGVTEMLKKISSNKDDEPPRRPNCRG